MNFKKFLCSVGAACCICFTQAQQFTVGTFAQQRNYSVSNAHAHNDYEHPAPFYTAYNAGFGSIEADIIFLNF